MPVIHMKPTCIEAQPALRRGDVAVWDLVDIPLGVRRGLVAMTPEEALDTRHYPNTIRHYQVWTARGSFAAVPWVDLQPMIKSGEPPANLKAAAQAELPLAAPRFVDAEPQRLLGDVAVWDLVDIPLGVQRRPAGETVSSAAASRGGFQLSPPNLWDRGERFAAVRWADLQPRRPVPRGRDTMTARQWGNDRDEHGVCRVCGADNSMHCDTVAHDQAREGYPLGASGVPSPRDRVPPPRQSQPAEPDPRASCIGPDAAPQRKAGRRLRPDEAPILVDLEFEPWE